jgi:SPP1 family phage portal protein
MIAILNRDCALFHLLEVTEMPDEQNNEQQQARVSAMPHKDMFGRRVIYTSEQMITADNVAKVVSNAYNTHLMNRGEIEYLWNYYKGKQPALYRTREIRPELTKHVVENRANQIVSFKVGYLAGKPIQYIASASGDKVSNSVAKLNDAMRVVGKHTKDKTLIEWCMICGVGYRYVVQERNRMKRIPFNLHTLDPRNTFVIRANDYSQRVMVAVNYVTDDNGNTTFTAFTEDRVYTIIKDSWTVTEDVNAFGVIPIIEYRANSAMLGCFEIVLGLLDAISDFDSMRNEAVEAFVQSLIVLYNCQVEDGTTASSIREAGLIQLKSIGDAKADVKILSEELNQQQNQTLKDDMYNTVLQIVGMPSQGDGNSSDSSNNAAVVLKNGWQGAETRAEEFEAMFREPEGEMLQVVSVLCDGMATFSFDPTVIDVKFTRRNYENILSKSQTLVTMLANDKIHPQKAYEASGLFVDTEEAYRMGMEWLGKQEAKAEPEETQSKVVAE